jgi:hypothetical protein
MAVRRTGLDLPMPLQFLAAWLAVWLGRVLQEQVEYLKAENLLLREKLGSKRVVLTVAERRKLAMLGKALGRKGLWIGGTSAIFPWPKCSRSCQGQVEMSGFPPAVSSGGRNSSSKDLRGFHPSESLSRATVQFASDGRQVGTAEGVQVSAFGKVLTKQAIGIFVAPTLPGAVWVTEEDVHVGIDRKLNVSSHLLALVPSQAPP